MSVEPASPMVAEDQSDQALSDALIAQHHLSEGDVVRIREMMAASRVGFGEAAVRASVVTPSELKETLAWLGRDSKHDANISIVYTAIRRISSGRQVVLRHATEVEPSSELLVAHQPYHPRGERMRSLRTELLLLNESSRRIMLAVLSPGRGEGRSLLAAELAITFSQLGRPTLLVDADLRNPRQHQLYCARNDWGLGQVLAFNDSLQLLGVKGLPYLSLLTAGPPTQNPLELLSDGRFAALLSTMQERYEFIILDTPPVGDCADALAIAALAQQVLVVTRAEATAHRDFKAMLRRVASTQARVIGAVLNKF